MNTYSYLFDNTLIQYSHNLLFNNFDHIDLCKRCIRVTRIPRDQQVVQGLFT